MRDKKNLSGVLEKAVPKSRFVWHVIDEKAGKTFGVYYYGKCNSCTFEKC